MISDFSKVLMKGSATALTDLIVIPNVSIN
nr:MAG TPA: hypothetical protein [Caudoviricetes sp.]